MKTDLDLNLLPVLVLLNKHRSLKAVAKALGKTESAVSKHLSKLREQLGDSLFVRENFRYQPTAWMASSLPDIENALGQLTSATENTAFDPKTYNKKVTVALPALGHYFIGKDLVMDLMKAFPNAHVSLVNWSKETPQALLDNEVDVSVNYFNDELDQRIHQTHLGRYRPSLITAKRNAHLSLYQRLNLPIVIMNIRGWSSEGDAIVQLVEQQGYQPKVIATVDNFTVLTELHKEMDCATFFPITQVPMPDLSAEFLTPELGSELLPPVVARYKQVNHGNPLHTKIMDILLTRLNLWTHSTARKYSLER